MKEAENIPLFQRIRIQLYKDISNGVFRVGDAIPTEFELMSRFNASRTTVRHATASLVNEGIIARQPGKGSFVRQNIAQPHMILRGSFKDILSVAKSTPARVLRFGYVDPPPDLIKQLLLKKHDRVLRIDRIRFAFKSPFLYSINYLPENVGKFLSKQDVEKKALIELLPEKCQVTLKSAVQNFSATVADDYMSDLLKVPIGFPLLEIKRTTFSTNDRPINLFIGFFRSDRYVFSAHFLFDEVE